MAYNELLEEMLDTVTTAWGGVDRKKMFGGLGYMLNGNMCVGIWKDSLILRLRPEEAESLKAKQSWARDFDITGRPMKGWVMVDPEGWEDPENLQKLAQAACSFVQTLPAKI